MAEKAAEKLTRENREFKEKELNYEEIRDVIDSFLRGTYAVQYTCQLAQAIYDAQLEKGKL